MTTEIVTVDDIEITPRLERILWRGLGTKSVRRIAEETGLTPEQVGLLKTELFDSVDALTETQSRTKLLVELENMVHEVRDRAAKADDEFYSGMMNSAISAIKAIQAERQRISKQDQSAVEGLNRMRVNELLRLIDITVARTLNEISTEYDLDESRLLEIFQNHLRPAAQELDN